MEASSKKGVFMTAVIHSKSERIDVRASTPVKQLLHHNPKPPHSKEAVLG